MERATTHQRSVWDIEDKIRDKERDQQFDKEFIELARAVYVTNDERAAVKRDDQHEAGITDRGREELREVQ